MVTKISLILTAFFIFTKITPAWADAWQLNKYNDQDIPSWLVSEPQYKKINSILQYKDVNLEPLFDAIPGKSGADFSKDQPFLVGASFVVNRPPVTFTKRKLLNPAGIETFSESKIQIIQQDPSMLEFQSSKSIPFGVLTCSNDLKVLDWNELMASSDLSNVYRSIASQISKTNGTPFITTYQDVSHCNDYFERSQILTFYFAVSASETKVLSLTFSYLNGVSYFVRKIMFSQVEDNLVNIPELVEELQGQ